jgi:predicted nucleic acid-binding Zn ribbon protein
MRSIGLAEVLFLLVLLLLALPIGVVVAIAMRRRGISSHRHCPSCGQALVQPQEARFCPFCGRPIT